MLIGIVLASAIQLLTGYFTETTRRPVRDIGQSSETGAATVILSGISSGMESAVYSALLIGGAVFGAYLLATGNATIALFAVAMAGGGLLTTVGVIVSMDSFGPVTDNAQGIAEMSGEVEGEAAQALTNLDAIGNTTKAITKGIAIATAVLAATALFGSFRDSVESALPASAASSFALNVAQPNVLVGVIIGASVVFLFSSLLIMAVGRAAQRVVLEVRMQFRNHPGIMTYEEKPDYSRVVDIVTADSLRELVTPGLLAVLTPIAVGFTFGYAPLGSFLVGAIAAGVLMAVFLSNSGGAWDNAKKLVEDGHHGGKGSAAHEATVIGDTVGDPFKDTAGPAINPLIKVMNLVSLLIATSVVKYSGNTGLRVGVALGAVIIIVAAIVYSKRRASRLGDEAPAEHRDQRRDRARGQRRALRTRGGGPRSAMPPVTSAPPSRGRGGRATATCPAARRRRPTRRASPPSGSRVNRRGRPQRPSGPPRDGRASAVRGGHGRGSGEYPRGPFGGCTGWLLLCGLVGGVDRVARDAEQVQDRVQVGDVDRGVGGVADHRLGVERDAEAGRADHAEVVGAVADGDGLRQRHARRLREPAQRLGLAVPVDDRLDDPAGQPAVGDLEGVRGHVVDAELVRQRLDHRGEPAADDPALVAEALQRPDQRARPRGEPQAGAAPRRGPRRRGRRAARRAPAATPRSRARRAWPTRSPWPPRRRSRRAPRAGR